MNVFTEDTWKNGERRGASAELYEASVDVSRVWTCNVMKASSKLTFLPPPHQAARNDDDTRVPDG